ncbi:hypothetical protein JW868_04785 [Candidatus Woesearchaeota archaeon]|nr:hypothetical protein [Candidatus Woesearchaeota archaeon]
MVANSMSQWDKTVEIMAIIGIVGIIALVVLAFVFTGGFKHTVSLADNQAVVGSAYSSLLQNQQVSGSGTSASDGVVQLISQGILKPFSDSNVVYFEEGVSASANGNELVFSNARLECGYPSGCSGYCDVTSGYGWARCSGTSRGMFCSGCVWDS